eukprot:Skav224905  [mRNA]  locus=scaffold1112:448009:460161:- [translate_table: standard]
MARPPKKKDPDIAFFASHGIRGDVTDTDGMSQTGTETWSMVEATNQMLVEEDEKADFLWLQEPSTELRADLMARMADLQETVGRLQEGIDAPVPDDDMDLIEETLELAEGMADASGATTLAEPDLPGAPGPDAVMDPVVPPSDDPDVEVDWGFVFVDDFCWLLRQTTSGKMATAILATLIALGTPLSWKKTRLAEINTWLGFVVHPNIPQVQMAAPKHVIVMELLTQLIEDKVFTAKEIEKALGRIQWATAVCPLTKSLMQPFWAWKMAVTSSGRPPKFVRLLALLLQHLFTRPYKQLSPYLPKSTWWGCSDASASSEGQAFIGGWLSSQPDPGKDTVWWFHMEITPQEFRWAFKEGDPKKRIAALELFATLILCHSMLDHQGHTTSHVRLPVGSDNQGNVFALLNMASKKPHTAILLMELILTLHTSGSSLAPSHVPRELNQWADELTHTDFVGFNSSLRIDVKAYLAKLLLVPRLRPDGQVDFTDSSTQNPGTGFGGLSCFPWLRPLSGASGPEKGADQKFCTG